MKMPNFSVSRFPTHRVPFRLLALQIGVGVSVLQIATGVASADPAAPFRFSHPDQNQQAADSTNGIPDRSIPDRDRPFILSGGDAPVSPVIADALSHPNPTVASVPIRLDNLSGAPAHTNPAHTNPAPELTETAPTNLPFQLSQTPALPEAANPAIAVGPNSSPNFSPNFNREALPQSTFSNTATYDPSAPFTFQPPSQATASSQPTYFTPAPNPSYQAPIASPAPQLPADIFTQVPSQSPVPGLSDVDRAPLTDSQPLLPATATTPPTLQLQGVYVLQGDDSSARARVSTTYPLTPQILFGGTLDLTSGNAFSDSPEDGLSINELYIATAPRDLPNLRFVLGQLDLTSYFDRNSFAKDGASQFFNPVFQTNPALTAASIGSRPGALVNWSVTDDLEARAAVFSSARSIGDFSLDGFAGEVGFRVGNAIIRGTYATARETGSGGGFREVFQVDRGDGQTGLLRGDRQESYGVNAEIFVPALNMGIFGRYGRYENLDLGLGGDTYSGGLNFFDVLNNNDRLGVAYGRGLSNEQLRRAANDRIPDVLEVFYDFPLLSNLRLGLTYQQLNEFSESIAGLRIRTEFDVTPRGMQ